jgi:hypothetical protein
MRKPGGLEKKTLSKNKGIRGEAVKREWLENPSIVNGKLGPACHQGGERWTIARGGSASGRITRTVCVACARQDEEWVDGFSSSSLVNERGAGADHSRERIPMVAGQKRGEP